jgi:hypothetical protein
MEMVNKKNKNKNFNKEKIFVIKKKEIAQVLLVVNVKMDGMEMNVNIQLVIQYHLIIHHQYVLEKENVLH